jgi:hypothetical protein
VGNVRAEGTVVAHRLSRRMPCMQRGGDNGFVGCARQALVGGDL